MWELDPKEGWVLENWYFRIVVWKKTLESPLDSKEIKPVNPKGNQPWLFVGRTGAETKAPTLWPSDEKSRLIKKSLMLGKIKVGVEREDRWWDGWMAPLTQWIWVWANQEVDKDRESWGAAVYGVTKSQIWLSDWTTTYVTSCQFLLCILKD